MGSQIRILPFPIFSSLPPFFFIACLDFEASAIAVAKIVKSRRLFLVFILCTHSQSIRSLLYKGFCKSGRSSLPFGHGNVLGITDLGMNFSWRRSEVDFFSPLMFPSVPSVLQKLHFCESECTNFFTENRTINETTQCPNVVFK